MLPLRSSLELSHEEEAELSRSTKKVKEYHANEPLTEHRQQGNCATTPPGGDVSRLSFKEKLIGEIPRAYIQAFDFSEYIENEMELESSVEVI